MTNLKRQMPVFLLLLLGLLLQYSFAPAKLFRDLPSKKRKDEWTEKPIPKKQTEKELGDLERQLLD